MKKTVFILTMVMMLILGNVTVALADAAAYDMNKADYYVYVATPDGGLNMRHGPGTDYAKVMDERIPDGVRLYIGFTSGNWGYTSYHGNNGWVALSQTTKTPPADNTYNKEKVDYYVYVTTPDGGLNMRHGPGTDYGKVMEERIPDGMQLHIEEVSGSWGYTSYHGNHGWVALNQTTTTPPASQPDQTPSNTPAPTGEVTEPAEIAEPAPEAPELETDSSEDAKTVKNTMLAQMILVAVLLVLVIATAVLIVIMINLKARK